MSLESEKRTGLALETQVPALVSTVNFLTPTCSWLHYGQHWMGWTIPMIFRDLFGRRRFYSNEILHKSKIWKWNQKAGALIGEEVKTSSASLESLSGLPTKTPSCSMIVFYDLFSPLFNWIGKATYMCPAKMVSVNIKDRHDIEIQTFQHFSHGCITSIC